MRVNVTLRKSTDSGLRSGSTPKAKLDSSDLNGAIYTSVSKFVVADVRVRLIEVKRLALTLNFERAGAVTVEVVVQTSKAASTTHQH